MIEKIYFTVVFVSILLYAIGCILMNVDEKREDMWFKITLTTVILILILIVGGMIAFIWLN